MGAIINADITRVYTEWEAIFGETEDLPPVLVRMWLGIFGIDETLAALKETAKTKKGGRWYVSGGDVDIHAAQEFVYNWLAKRARRQTSLGR